MWGVPELNIKNKKVFICILCVFILSIVFIGYIFNPKYLKGTQLVIGGEYTNTFLLDTSFQTKENICIWAENLTIHDVIEYEVYSKDTKGEYSILVDKTQTDRGEGNRKHVYLNTEKNKLYVVKLKYNNFLKLFEFSLT